MGEIVIRRWMASPHLRPIAYLASGSGLAQLISLLVTPIITRLYTPGEYGTISIYGSIVAIVAAVAAGKYESAISLPAETDEGESDAIGLVRVALVVAVATSLVSLLAVFILLLWGGIASLESLGYWAYAIPLGVLLSAASATLGAYATRRRRYGTLARIAPMQKVVSAGLQLAGGALRLGVSGLMIGVLAAPFVGLGVQSKIYREGSSASPSAKWDWSELRRLAQQYRDFPLVSTWFALLNAMAWNIQAIVIARYYSVADVGHYSLATAMISVPMGLILVGVSQVFLRESAARADNPSAAMRLARETLKSLAVVSVPLFGVLFFASLYLFEPVFGEKWAGSSAIAVSMLPLLWARFLTTSLTTVFPIYRRQGRLLIWQIIALAVTLGGFIVGGTMALPISTTTLVVSLGVAPLYLALLPMVFRTIRQGPKR